MPGSRYVMRDLNGHKIDGIMRYNVAQRRNRSRSILEITLFLMLLVAYLGALSLSN
jgi:hypothetical protein